MGLKSITSENTLLVCRKWRVAIKGIQTYTVVEDLCVEDTKVLDSCGQLVSDY